MVIIGFGIIEICDRTINKGEKMKRLILILAFVLFSSFVFANDGVIKYFDISIQPLYKNTFGIVCIDGYKFAFMKASGDNGVALVQIFGYAAVGTYQNPIKCKN